MIQACRALRPAITLCLSKAFSSGSDPGLERLGSPVRWLLRGPGTRLRTRSGSRQLIESVVGPPANIVGGDSMRSKMLPLVAFAIVLTATLISNNWGGPAKCPA